MAGNSSMHLLFKDDLLDEINLINRRNTIPIPAAIMRLSQLSCLLDEMAALNDKPIKAALIKK